MAIKGNQGQNILEEEDCVSFFNGADGSSRPQLIGLGEWGHSACETNTSTWLPLDLILGSFPTFHQPAYTQSDSARWLLLASLMASLRSWRR